MEVLSKFKKLHTKSKNFIKYLEDVLEGEKDLQLKAAPATAFEVRGDIESILTSATFSRLSPKSETVFNELAPFFEAGFFLRMHKTQWQFERLFLFGRTFNVPDSWVETLDLELPKMKVMQVSRTSGWSVLKKLDLDSLVRLRESQAFLIKVQAEVIFLLICNRAAHWQKEHLEKTHTVIKRWLETAPTQNLTKLRKSEPRND